MKKILVVDDESDTLELLKDVLGEAGYKVVTASTGKEALRKFHNPDHFDLISLDIMMPDLSGWDVYQRIRKENKKVKIIFLSVLEVSPKRVRQLKKDGVSDYLTKPFTKDSLLPRIGKILAAS